MTIIFPSWNAGKLISMNHPPPFTMACPNCRRPMTAVSESEYRCEEEGFSYPNENGIWRFLPPDREAYFGRFISDYENIRQAESRGAQDEQFYRALPFRDLKGNFKSDWKIRSISFQSLISNVIIPLEETTQRPLKAIDLGAGNGWLSYRLAEREHQVCAVDLVTNSWDGLGAHIHYDLDFTPLQSEFDRLPLVANEVDLVIFNASLHYSEDFSTSLSEALRVLKTEGLVVIMDSPVYRDPDSGAQMVQEREATFRKNYGYASNALNSENYLTFDRLDDLGTALGIKWQFIKPFYGFAWSIRPWKARLRGHREPASFLILVGKNDRDTKE
jgi:SAM-dependent methyltransferase